MDIETQMILAATVHDVKNSLGLIDGQLNEVAHRIEKIDDQSAQEIRRIQLECGRINNGLVHMLGLYKMQKGRFNPNFDEILVSDVLEDTAARYKEMLNSMNIELILNIKSPDSVWLMDSMLIEGLLANVMTNTIRYTKSTLQFDVDEIDGWLNIKITDDGQGYPESMVEFVKEPEKIDFQTGSTGLGLYFCQRIAGMHTNGDQVGYISLSNNEAGGASFDLWLP
jgi:K+-sensing histidine kinase KdpD